MARANAYGAFVSLRDEPIPAIKPASKIAHREEFFFSSRDSQNFAIIQIGSKIKIAEVLSFDDEPITDRKFGVKVHARAM